MATWIVDDKVITTHPLPVFYSWLGWSVRVWNGKIKLSSIVEFPVTRQRHEMAHLYQEKEIGVIKYRLLYIREWCRNIFNKPYYNNPFEREARALEMVYRGWENVTKDSWRGYV